MCVLRNFTRNSLIDPGQVARSCILESPQLTPELQAMGIPTKRMPNKPYSEPWARILMRITGAHPDFLPGCVVQHL